MAGATRHTMFDFLRALGGKKNYKQWSVGAARHTMFDFLRALGGKKNYKQ
jgi:phosphotransferase system IIB component